MGCGINSTVPVIFVLKIEGKFWFCSEAPGNCDIPRLFEFTTSRFPLERKLQYAED